MKTIETKLYSYSELSNEAKERVIRDLSESVHDDPDNFTLSQCIDSLKAVVKHMGLRLTDWNIGPYNRSNSASINDPWWNNGVLDGGNKTVAFFLRSLIQMGYPRPKKFSDMEFTGICGFTGTYFDEDICETIYKSLMSGESMNEAVDSAADRIMRICEEDLEYRASEEGILEYLDVEEEVYTEDGERWWNMPSFRISNNSKVTGIIHYSSHYRLRTKSGGYFYMTWHDYLGPVVYYDKYCNRENENWFDDEGICDSIEWFQKRGKRC